jgi:hypothetical protein
MTDENLLLVEGKDDQHVVYHLAEHHRLPERFTVKDKGGAENLLTTLKVELKASGLERLGIIADADTDLRSRWQAIRDILAAAGYAHIPLVPDPDGAIIRQEGRPTVGIWIMPDNTLSSGMLEHFIGFLVPAGDPLWYRAEDCIEHIPPETRRFPPQHQIKAHVHTWLAWQIEPGAPLGQAITKRYLDADAPHARQLIAWLRRLFEL